jgi:hypothetical protein
MGKHYNIHEWIERFRESWVFRFWLVRGAILLLLFLILLIVIFEMDWLSYVVAVLIPVVAVVVFISLVASVNDLIRMFKK